MADLDPQIAQAVTAKVQAAMQEAMKWNTYEILLNSETLHFGFACGIVSLLVMCADWVSVTQLNKESALSIPYKGLSWSKWIKLLIAWWGAAAIVGYLSVLTEVLQMSKQTMLAIGLAWPVAFAKLLTTPATLQNNQSNAEAAEAEAVKAKAAEAEAAKAKAAEAEAAKAKIG